RHIQARQSECVRDGPLVAKVWQRNYHAIDGVPMPLEKLGASFRFFEGFDRPKFRFIGDERGIRLGAYRSRGDDVDVGVLQDANHLFTSACGQVVGEEAPIPDDEAELCIASIRCWHLVLPWKKSNQVKEADDEQ